MELVVGAVTYLDNTHPFFVEFENDGDLFDGSGLGKHYFDNEDDAKDALLRGK